MGKALDNRPIQIVGCVFACILIVVWFFVVAMMIRAVIQKQILWPQKQEDKDEGGWKSENAGLTSENSRGQSRGENATRNRGERSRRSGRS